MSTVVDSEDIQQGTISSVAVQESIPESNTQEFKGVGDDEVLKAVKFWNHPSLSLIPVPEKISYLKAKGFSEQDIHLLWDKLMEQSLREDSQSDEELRGEVKSQNYSSIPTPGGSKIVTSSAKQNILQSPPQVPPLLHDTLSERENSHSLPLLAVGSMLGLTAAAAVRWLNGGDFHLFPPAGVYRDQQTTEESPNILEETEFNMRHEIFHPVATHSTNTTINNDAVESLSRDIQDLKTVLKEQHTMQEKWMQTVLTKETKQMTDQSIIRLREIAPLLEIQGLMEKLSSDDDNAVQALKKLRDYIENLQKVQSEEPKSDLVHSQKALTPIPVATDMQDTQRKDDNINNNELAITRLRDVIQQLVSENKAMEDIQGGCQILYLYVFHLSSHPHIPRYRKIYTTNDSFRTIEKLVGGLEFLRIVGFIERDGYLEWKPEDEDLEKALQLLQMASTALRVLKNDSNYLPGITVNRENLCHEALACFPSDSNEIKCQPPSTTTSSSSSAPYIKQQQQLEQQFRQDNGDINQNGSMSNAWTPPTINKNVAINQHLDVLSPPTTKKHSRIGESFLPTPCAGTSTYSFMQEFLPDDVSSPSLISSTFENNLTLTEGTQWEAKEADVGKEYSRDSHDDLENSKKSMLE